MFVICRDNLDVLRPKTLLLKAKQLKKMDNLLLDRTKTGPDDKQSGDSILSLSISPFINKSFPHQWLVNLGSEFFVRETGIEMP